MLSIVFEDVDLMKVVSIEYEGVNGEYRGLPSELGGK